MTPKRRRSRLATVRQANPWRSRGVDRRGRRYTRRRAVTPGNSVRGWLIFVLTVVLIVSFINVGWEALFG